MRSSKLPDREYEKVGVGRVAIDQLEEREWTQGLGGRKLQSGERIGSPLRVPPPISGVAGYHTCRTMPERNIAVVILVTAPDGQVAAEIARRLLEERLVACANIVPGLRSLYWWEGAVQDDSEVLMLLKGREEDVEVIAERVQELHPYSVPEVVATEIVAGLDAYLDWIWAETERNDA